MQKTTNPQNDILLPGIFTVNSMRKKVRFTRGNLMANVNTDSTKITEWKLAEHQYDNIGNTEAQRQCRRGWVDLFGWTAAGKYADGIKQYGINRSQTKSDYYISTEIGITNTDTPCDWGSLVGTGLSLLSNTEWEYLLTHALAKNSSNKNDFTIAGQKCAILKPDGYNDTVADSYTVQEWAAAETNGLVALPFAGGHYGSSVLGASDHALYWSSAPVSSGGAFYASVYSDNAYVGLTIRIYGHTVRLVSVV